MSVLPLMNHPAYYILNTYYLCVDSYNHIFTFLVFGQNNIVDPLNPVVVPTNAHRRKSKNVMYSEL